MFTDLSVVPDIIALDSLSIAYIFNASRIAVIGIIIPMSLYVLK